MRGKHKIMQPKYRLLKYVFYFLNEFLSPNPVRYLPDYQERQRFVSFLTEQIDGVIVSRKLRRNFRYRLIRHCVDSNTHKSFSNEQTHVLSINGIPT